MKAKTMLQKLKALLARDTRHKDSTPQNGYRLVLLTDDPYNIFLGNREWCDGKARPCRVCGGNCCTCRHTERRPA